MMIYEVTALIRTRKMDQIMLLKLKPRLVGNVLLSRVKPTVIPVTIYRYPVTFSHTFMIQARYG